MAFIVAHVFQQMDRKKKTWTSVGKTEYTVLLREFSSVSLTWIIKAKKFVKKITRHPYLAVD